MNTRVFIHRLYLTRVVGGKLPFKRVRTSLRRLVAAESASNDGMAYPFLTITIYVLTEATAGTAVGKWIILGCLCMYLLRRPTPMASQTTTIYS